MNNRYEYRLIDIGWGVMRNCVYDTLLDTPFIWVSNPEKCKSVAEAMNMRYPGDAAILWLPARKFSNLIRGQCNTTFDPHSYKVSVEVFPGDSTWLEFDGHSSTSPFRRHFGFRMSDLDELDTFITLLQMVRKKHEEALDE